jgi:hypothetical protein
MPLPTDDDEELDEEVLDTLYLKVYTGQLDTTSTSAPPPPKEATAAGDGPDKATAKGEKKEEEEDGEVVDEKRKAELAREKDEEEVAQLINIATETKVCVRVLCVSCVVCRVRELTCVACVLCAGTDVCCVGVQGQGGASSRRYWGSETDNATVCFNCGGTGHFSRDCIEARVPCTRHMTRTRHGTTRTRHAHAHDAQVLTIVMWRAGPGDGVHDVQSGGTLLAPVPRHHHLQPLQHSGTLCPGNQPTSPLSLSLSCRRSALTRVVSCRVVSCRAEL